MITLAVSLNLVSFLSSDKSLDYTVYVMFKLSYFYLLVYSLLALIGLVPVKGAAGGLGSKVEVLVFLKPGVPSLLALLDL